MDRYIGKLLDNRYEILEKIGSGGMADVYKARCHRLNRLVAIKILKEDLSQDAEFRRRFHAESQAVAMLSHPNIVSVYDVSHSDNIDYIVMELIDGITLKQYMEQKGTLNWREALHFATQIAKALEPYNPFWFEDPIQAFNVEALSEFAHSTHVATASSETVGSIDSYRDICAAKAAEIITFDPTWTGGVTEAKKIIGLTEVH